MRARLKVTGFFSLLILLGLAVPVQAAELSMDQGELETAVTSFDSFLDEYGQSDLRLNALFGKSISLAGLGQLDESKAAMRLFVDENPNHPWFLMLYRLLASSISQKHWPCHKPYQPDFKKKLPTLIRNSG